MNSSKTLLESEGRKELQMEREGGVHKCHKTSLQTSAHLMLVMYTVYIRSFWNNHEGSSFTKLVYIPYTLVCLSAGR